ncbi:MAG: sulfatase/phosphatase domain-containing protein, partial [Rubripirellula sp.]
PFREYKHYVHEGGIATPLIVHWPERVKRTGELERTPGHLVDLMATAVDVSGANYPTEHLDQKIKPMEGKSLVPAFLGKPVEREAIYWEHEGNRAVRVGDHKLVAIGAKGKWELYNIATDRSEQHDLIEEQPELAKRLQEMWEAYAERANVLPLNPGAKQSNHSGNNKKQKYFELKLGDNLSTEKAPFVQRRAFRVSATVNAQGDGVIVAQGGTAHGWALYVQGGKLTFARTIGGKRDVLVCDESVPPGKAVIDVEHSKNGQVVVAVNDKVAGQAKFKGPLTSQPADGLQVGSDTGGNVGNYSAPFTFKGQVDEVVVSIE